MGWRTARGAQGSIQAVGEAVADYFGESTKEDLEGPLSRGYVGTAGDDATESLVVVVDPALVDMRDLTSKLETAAGRGGVKVRVEAAKVSASELLAARQVIAARDWHPDACRVGMAFGIDAAACRYRVTFDRKNEHVARALEARLGDLVRIEWGTLQRR
jgi:hypothetical protein